MVYETQRAALQKARSATEEFADMPTVEPLRMIVPMSGEEPAALLVLPSRARL